jgi:hypothetical protein
MLNNKCDICPEPANYFLEAPEEYSHLPTVNACGDHATYMKRWMRESIRECECDSRASWREDHQRD